MDRLAGSAPKVTMMNKGASTSKMLKFSGIVRHLGESASLVAGLEAHDFRAANTFMKAMYPDDGSLVRRIRFMAWAIHQVFRIIPDALSTVSFARCVSKVPVWLAEGNPFANYPWSTQPDAQLPDEVEVAVIGAGFTGAGCAYHWAKQGAGDMVVLEMNDPASGASGSNEGVVVMGRYFAMVRGTVRKHLESARPDLTPMQRHKLASQFATAYAKSAYKNACLIEETIAKEQYDCDYVRNGWIQAVDVEDQALLEESLHLDWAAGFNDRSRIQPDEALSLGGIQLDCAASFSKGAAHFHPAKWVWCLLNTALEQPSVSLFTRTKVLQVEDAGEHYLVHTTRGAIKARFVINATESFTGLLHAQYRDLIEPVQTQAAFAEGGPSDMKPDIGYSCKRGFFGRFGHPQGVLFGSDETHLSYREAGSNHPSRFITKFLVGEIQKYFGRSSLHVTREWSSTAGFTPDEFPVVGLLDGKRQYIIGGMCGSGTAVSFNGARHVVQQILGLDGPDDYPTQYFAPTRLLAPELHPWPEIVEENIR
ncbi:MAG: FAD-binding oxidoreductase [Chloroflexi bacterium]|nr:FAD-binding oxidoreductase [Chloroflexota bacterium]